SGIREHERLSLPAVDPFVRLASVQTARGLRGSSEPGAPPNFSSPFRGRLVPQFHCAQKSRSRHSTCPASLLRRPVNARPRIKSAQSREHQAPACSTASTSCENWSPLGRVIIYLTH